MMDASVKQHYLADSPPSVVRLEIKSHFDTLKDESLRRYAHYMSRSVVSLNRCKRCCGLLDGVFLILQCLRGANWDV